MVLELEAEVLHFEHGIFGAPVFYGHAIGRDHHSSTIVAKPAMDEYLFVGIVLHQPQETGKIFVMRKWAVPWNRYVLHPHVLDHLAFSFGAISPRIDHNVNAHFRERFESFSRRLPTSIERGAYLPEIRIRR